MPGQGGIIGLRGTHYDQDLQIIKLKRPIVVVIAQTRSCEAIITSKVPGIALIHRKTQLGQNIGRQIAVGDSALQTSQNHGAVSW